ncbi:MAG: response regulator transcription factor [Sphaerochaetaceae bacterium]|nr:response regulator transcription factor [Sphaerochaetaceae bacterium]
MKLIYIVEDHQVIREGVRRYLEMSGYSALGFGTLSTAEQAISVRKPDLIIQDVMLPDGDGFEFIEKLRKNMDVAVIFMTAKIAEDDRIHGLELGADDYICKPFSPKELVLRVQALFRRMDAAGAKSATSSTVILRAGDGVMEFNEGTHLLKVNGEDVGLTAAEWRILVYFLNNISKILSRSDILRECFDYESESYDRIADTHIKNLRAKLGPFPWIETVRGYGYRFIGYITTD